MIQASEIAEFLGALLGAGFREVPVMDSGIKLVSENRTHGYLHLGESVLADADAGSLKFAIEERIADQIRAGHSYLVRIDSDGVPEFIPMG